MGKRENKHIFTRNINMWRPGSAKPNNGASNHSKKAKHSKNDIQGDSNKTLARKASKADNKMGIKNNQNNDKPKKTLTGATKNMKVSYVRVTKTNFKYKTNFK